MISDDISQNLKDYLDRQRTELSDFILLYRYRRILYQYKYKGRAGLTLYRYANELEYRGIDYEK